MRLKNSHITIITICALLLGARFYNYITLAKLPKLVEPYDFELCPVSIDFPDNPYLEESFGFEKISATVDGYYYRAACIPLDKEDPGEVSLLPMDLLEMFNADEIIEITDVNFELSGLSGGPFFIYEYLGEHDDKEMKSIGAVYFHGIYILNAELITFDREQDNIDPSEYFESVVSHIDQLENLPKRPSRNGPLI